MAALTSKDIKAPECFYIEQKLRERMNIPVFHDDQHGTAIISTAAILNGLRVVEKNISDVRMVVSGAGAAGNRLYEPAGRVGDAKAQHRGVRL
ncbi:NADP-dependent malate dehydrogenase [Salmonella enterica subsp. enterica]|uniref:NADP-dependent malate dehydrogenase n=1 Tax=Salmonella enterica I TaxID=59201 RepID=A0A3S4GHT0_SALET|nr:NADP-dependent malate dehydrogenase [Salmonella enterica subsp. enterica]